MCFSQQSIRQPFRLRQSAKHVLFVSYIIWSNKLKSLFLLRVSQVCTARENKSPWRRAVGWLNLDMTDGIAAPLSSNAVAFKSFDKYMTWSRSSQDLAISSSACAHFLGSGPLQRVLVRMFTRRASCCSTRYSQESAAWKFVPTVVVLGDAFL